MLSSPGMAWQAALKMTDVNLDLFTDINRHLFIEKGIRGGIFMISHQSSEANHPQCPNYDFSKANKYITCLDSNNLYGLSERSSFVSDENKRKIGYFKDELNGQAYFEFVGLRSKMYSILSDRGQKQRAKGISKSVRQQKLKHANFRQCLLSRKPSSALQSRIGSERHHIFSMQQLKRAFSAFDDKRFLLEDGVTSLSYGHYKIV
ncbi:hypothetical protein AVEN_114615-1 [Araneus ventricosus]|uniref:DNA-directed DNA polymerase n=1 Tax=Araneus ventricosus TaxID=182803 RepID=A0A4Y2GG18_ARAVE|nr:hypothetical protein AVEN_114615-1 [Araneus ventricosus]